MHKKEFNNIMKYIDFYLPNYFSVIIDLGLGEYELVVNTINCFEDKLKYYLENYDDNMIHKHSPSRIVDVIAADSLDIIADEFMKYGTDLEIR